MEQTLPISVDEFGFFNVKHIAAGVWICEQCQENTSVRDLLDFIKKNNKMLNG
jgi:hypothetical protein